MLDYDKLSQEIIQYRRDLHQIPELGFYVYKTCAYVCKVLAPLDCTTEKILQTGGNADLVVAKGCRQR